MSSQFADKHSFMSVASKPVRNRQEKRKLITNASGTNFARVGEEFPVSHFTASLQI